MAYEAICRHGVLSSHEMVSPGKCKMPLSLVTFNTTQDKKKRVCNSHKKVDIIAAAVLSTSRFPEPRKQLSELGRAEAVLRFQQEG